MFFNWDNLKVAPSHEAGFISTFRTTTIFNNVNSKLTWGVYLPFKSCLVGDKPI